MQTAERPDAQTIPASDDSEFRAPMDIWREVVADRPDAVAACDCEQGARLTFREVDRHSDVLAQRISRRLLTLGAGKESPIAVLLEHNRLFATAAVAVFKTGWPEVVLDPSVPAERLRTIITSSGARVILTTAELHNLASELGAVDIVVMERLEEPLAPPFTPAEAHPADISGIIYTSGSTGAPKGVAVNYRTLSHQRSHRQQADWIRPDDRLGLVMPLSFGAARGDLNTALQSGASAHFFNPRERGAGPLPAWLAEHQITVLPAPPSLLTAVVRTLEDGETLSGSLRMVRSGGEKLLCSDAVAIRRALPGSCRLLNVFGSTETTMVSAYEITADTPDVSRPVPAGWPILGYEVAFEREDGSAPEPGEPAELVVISRYLPVGYWNDETRTRQRYRPLPDGRVAVATGDLAMPLRDGSFRLAGRKDLSLKIRGNLVEPAEVEAALLHCEGIADAVVIGRPNQSGRERLIGYVVLKPRAPIVRAAELRRALRKTLPGYMIPEAIVFLAELPRNERSKLDRSQLPDPPARAAGDAIAPRTAWEQQVAAVWAEVLGLPSIGMDDDFFDLGGDSLSAEEIVSRLAGQHGVEVSSRLLLTASTAGEFAAATAGAPSASPDAGFERLVAIRAQGSRPPLFCVAGAGRLGMTFRPLAAHLGDDQPVWALQGSGREQRKLPEWSVRRIARHNLAEVRSVQPHGPYFLTGHSFGGVVAFEMAQQLRAAGVNVALLMPLDSFGPHPKALPRMRRRSARDWGRTISKYVRLRAATGRPPQPDEQPASDLYVGQTRLISYFYRGRPYPGRTVLFAAQERADHPNAKLRRAGWEPFLTGQHTLRMTAGAHLTMLNEPHASTLAALIREEMDQVLTG